MASAPQKYNLKFLLTFSVVLSLLCFKPFELLFKLFGFVVAFFCLALTAYNVVNYKGADGNTDKDRHAEGRLKEHGKVAELGNSSFIFADYLVGRIRSPQCCWRRLLW